MQYHGAPIRLLDLNWSPYVAVFFCAGGGCVRFGYLGAVSSRCNRSPYADIAMLRHGRQLRAHGLESEEESAIHDRDSNIVSGTGLLKAELLTLRQLVQSVLDTEADPDVECPRQVYD
jgi:hypothetical protein